MEDRQTKKFTDIDIVNQLSMRYFRMGIPQSGNLLISGDIGYADYYSMYLTFIDVKYMACVFFIDDIYWWRLASPAETASVLDAFLSKSAREKENITVYCLEEGHYSSKGGRKFFIAARAVEIVVHYDANNPHHLTSLGLNKPDDGA